MPDESSFRRDRAFHFPAPSPDQILQKNNIEETAKDYRFKGIEKTGLNV